MSVRDRRASRLLVAAALAVISLLTLGPVAAPASAAEYPVLHTEVGARRVVHVAPDGKVYAAWLEEDWRLIEGTVYSVQARIQIARILPDGTGDPAFTRRDVPIDAEGLARGSSSCSDPTWTAAGDILVMCSAWADGDPIDSTRLAIERLSPTGARLSRTTRLYGSGAQPYSSDVTEDGRFVRSTGGQVTLRDGSFGDTTVSVGGDYVDRYQIRGGPLYIVGRTPGASTAAMKRVSGSTVDLEATLSCPAGSPSAILPGASTAYAVVCGSALTFRGSTTWNRQMSPCAGPRGFVTSDGKVVLGCGTFVGSSIGTRFTTFGATGDPVASPTLLGEQIGWFTSIAPLSAGRFALATPRDDGDSDGTIVTSFSFGAVPAAPSNVRASIAGRSATVTWTPPPAVSGFPVLRYEMVVSADGVDLQARDIGLGTSEVVPDLGAGVIYRFRVRAVNANGPGAWSVVSNPVTPVRAPFPSHAAAAERLSSELLGRPPTSAERAAWVPRLESGALTPGGLVAELRDGTDNLSRVDPVVRLYQAYFLRRPDAAGLTYWAAQRRAGRSLQSISDYFRRSAEFVALYGTLTNREFVELIYTNILGRPGEPGGVTYWTGELDSGRRSRGSVMVGFSEAAEYRNAQASEVDVSVLYILLLGRTPTAAEYAADVAALDAATLTVTALADRLIATTDYATRT